jgi:neutral ceramidase
MERLQAGAARVVITPPVGVPLAGYFAAEGRRETAQEIHDDLYARALVLDDGHERVALVTVDLIGLGSDVLAEVRALVAREAGIAPDRLMLACTHTHSGPVPHAFPPSDLLPGQPDAAYLQLLPRLIASAVLLAARRRRAARLGAGRGRCAININRREFLPDGTLRGLPFLGKNPQGVTDREVAVLRVDEAESGRPLALLVNYACHPVVLGPNLAISADFPGYTLSFLEGAFGGGTVALFANGAQGDQNPLIHPGSDADAQRLGTILGAEALRVALEIETRAPLRLSIATLHGELPLNPASEPARQRAFIEQLQAEYARFKAAGDEERAWDREMRLAVAAYRLLTREQLPQPFLPAEVMAWGLQGDGVSVGLVSEPAELFCAYGLQVRERSPFATTLIVGLANGFIGYVPTPEVYREGGYECEATNVAPEAGALLAKQMEEALRLCYERLQREE